MYHKNSRSDKFICAAIGYFDGVHRGHMAVIRQAVQCAREQNAAAAVITFDMSENRARQKGAKDLMTKSYKQEILSAAGIQAYYALPFSDIADMSGETFVTDILHSRYRTVALCCGQNFRFGHNRACGPKELNAYCTQNGIRLHIVDAVLDEGSAVSTTRIKQAVAAGDMPHAASMLGRPYQLCLEVYEEKKLARTLGFPTINQRFPDIITPKFGVYQAKVMLDGREYDAVSNIGVRPTVEHGGSVTLETHILDYDGSLYGREVAVTLECFLREECEFKNAEQLKAAVLRDIQTVRELAKADRE